MSTEFVGIQLELMGADGVRRDLENLDNLLNSFRGKKKFDIGLNEARTQVVAFKGELEKLKREQSKVEKGSDEWNDYAAQIEKVRNKLWNAQQAVREFGQASREAGRTFMQTFNAISSKVAHVGSAMQSFGNAMTQLTSPFRRLTSGIVMGAGFKVFDQFTQGIENSFTRADVMRKYPRVMQALGYSAQQAQNSIDKLDASVQGLPTSLDEIVGMSQRFTATIGDLSKGTDVAIAANNAFLASMSTETQRYQGMMQLQDVLGGKKLNAREWYSLANSMMPAIRMMGESLGYEGQALDDYVAKVQQGKISNKEFIDTLIKAGTDDNGKIRKIAMESLDTWEAFFSRIRTAASRLGYKGIIEPLNTLVETVTGGKFKSVNLLLDDFIINRIDKMQSSVKKWIEAHPEEITNFFKDLSKIKMGNFIRGYAKGLEWMIGLVERLATTLGKHPKLMGFLGGFFGVGGMIGRMSTIFGGLLKGTRHIWGGIGAGGSWLLKGKLGKIGLFGKIASLFGKKKDIEAAGETAKTIPTIANTFKGAFNALQGVMTAAGAVVLVSGAGFVAFKSIKSIVKDLKEIGDVIKGMTWADAANGASIIASIGVFVKIFSAVGEALGPQGLLGVAIASAATFFIAGSFAADMWAIKTGLQQVHDTILEFDKIGSAITNMKGLAGINTGAGSKLKASVDAINDIISVLGGRSGGPADRGEYSKGLPMFTGFRVAALENITSALTQMQKIVEQFNKLSALTVNDPSKVITDIKNACNQLQGIRGPKNLLKHTQKVADALIQIRRMAYHINKLAGTEVNAGGFATFVQQIKNALADLKNLSGDLMLDIEVKLSPMFGSSVEGVKKNIKNAKRDIEKFKAPIRYNIPVTVTFSVSTNAWSAIARIRDARARVRQAREGAMSQQYQAKGGMIYRAGGGGVPWRRRGTDTVPAMLTPGEYVHNKRAVSAFGIDFMRKVNNLDMKGAMNELMHRAGHMANINRGTSITNNYNNNQKVVINNSNAGAGFTFRTASRFVGAF